MASLEPPSAGFKTISGEPFSPFSKRVEPESFVSGGAGWSADMGFKREFRLPVSVAVTEFPGVF